MIYHLPLQTVGLIAGIFLVLLSLPGILKPGLAQSWAKRLPRSRIAGIVLLTVDLAWSFWLLATMEMGEFSSFRRPLLIALPIDRKSTRLNSSHRCISYAVFCLK